MPAFEIVSPINEAGFALDNVCAYSHYQLLDDFRSFHLVIVYYKTFRGISLVLWEWDDYPLSVGTQQAISKADGARMLHRSRLISDAGGEKIFLR